MHLSARLLFGFAAALSASTASAAVAADQYQQLQWRTIGPFRGGRVLAVAGVPDKPLEFLFGSVNGGVWKTRDAGRTWQPIFDAQPIGSIGALAIAPSDPKVIYVGSGESDMRSDISQGNGMYKSIDGGATWSHIGLDDSQQIARILIDPEHSDRVYVAALGHPYGPNHERGVFRSDDGGAHWKKLLGGDDHTGAIDLVFEPGNPRVIYAAMWQTRRTPWSVYPPSNGPGSEVFKSTDGGEHWTSLAANGLPGKHGRIGLAIGPSEPKRVYAVVDADEGGLYRSDDGGGHFSRSSSDNRIWTRGWYFGEIRVDPQNADIVYAMNTILLRSTDGGKSFAPIKGDATGDDFHALWIDPVNPARQILGGDQGALVTLNGGQSWSSWHNQPTGQFYHVATDRRFPYFVYGAQQDSGAAGVPSRTGSYDGINLTQFRELTAGGESDNIAPDPQDPDLIYGGRVDITDLRTQQTRSIDPTLAFPDHHRRTWTLPLVFSRRDPSVLYFANQRLYRTADQGQHWTQISGDLTREDPGSPSNLDPASAANNLQMGPRRGVIYSIAPSRLADHDIWVGTDDGQIWRTRDEGAQWSNLTPRSLGPWSKVGTLEASHFDAETAYAAIDRHRLDDFRPHILSTHDGGKNWTEIVAGIAIDRAVNVVREDPLRRGLLYAGTERGIYLSFDDGLHWQSLQQNLPITSVRDLEVHDNDLVIATHGRGFWIMDDVSALRELAQAADRGSARLYAPAAAIRTRPATFNGTPFPKDEATANNPPHGASIDYYLPQASAAAITLSIRNDKGERVRSYSSADKLPPFDPAKAGTAPEWAQVPVGLVNAPGAHRFIWPFRYAPQGKAAASDPFADGVWAPPGTYWIELTVDGKAQTRELQLQSDPRIELSAAAYAEQFALARQVELLMTAAQAQLAEAEQLLKSIETQGALPAPALQVERDRLRERIWRISGIVASTNPANTWWLPPKEIESLRYSIDALGKLGGAIDGADAAVTADARAGLEMQSRIAARVAQQWQALKQTELATLNHNLTEAGIKPLQIETPKPETGP